MSARRPKSTWRNRWGSDDPERQPQPADRAYNHSWGHPIWTLDDEHPQKDLHEPKWRQRAYRRRAYKDPAAARMTHLIESAGSRLMAAFVHGLIHRPTQ